MGLDGVAPCDIDLVLRSHLHLDHTGWMTRAVKGGWQPTFPGRRHLISQTEIDYWTTHNRRHEWMVESLDDTLRPLLDAGLVDGIAPGHKLGEGLRLLPLVGNSPDMFGLRIERAAKPVFWQRTSPITRCNSLNRSSEPLSIMVRWRALQPAVPSLKNTPTRRSHCPASLSQVRCSADLFTRWRNGGVLGTFLRLM